MFRAHCEQTLQRMAEQLNMVAGKRVGGGSRKGVPNRTSAVIRSAIVETFERVGGIQYLEQVARAEPKVFCTLLAKVLPRQTAVQESEREVSTLSDAEIRSRVALMLREGLSAEAISTGDSIEAEAVTLKRDA